MTDLRPWTAETFVHECGHALVAALSGGQPSVIRRVDAGRNAASHCDMDGVDRPMLALGGALAVNAYRMASDPAAREGLRELSIESWAAMAMYSVQHEPLYGADLKILGDHDGRFDGRQAEIAALITRFGIDAHGEHAEWIAERVADLNQSPGHAFLISVDLALRLIGVGKLAAH